MSSSQLRRMSGAQPASKTRVIIVSISMPIRTEIQKSAPTRTERAWRLSWWATPTQAKYQTTARATTPTARNFFQWAVRA